MTDSHDTAGAGGQSALDRSRTFALISEQIRRPRVIDLANNDGPEPVVILPVEVKGRFLIGHTWSITDPDEPVLVRQRDIMEPGPLTADLRCRGCSPRTQIGRLGDDTLALLEHQDGCPRLADLADLAAKAGVL